MQFHDRLDNTNRPSTCAACGFPRQLTDDERVLVEEAVAAVEAVKQAAAADEGGVWEWQGDYGGGWRAFKADVAAKLVKLAPAPGASQV